MTASLSLPCSAFGTASCGSARGPPRSGGSRSPPLLLLIFPTSSRLLGCRPVRRRGSRLHLSRRPCAPLGSSGRLHRRLCSARRPRGPFSSARAAACTRTLLAATSATSASGTPPASDASSSWRCEARRGPRPQAGRRLRRRRRRRRHRTWRPGRSWRRRGRACGWR